MNAPLYSDSAASFPAEAPAKHEAPEDVHMAEPEKPRKKFRIVATLVAAVKRFEMAINPTISVGREPRAESCMPAPVVLRAMAAKDSSRPRLTTTGRYSGRASSGRTASGRPIGMHHGCKGAILFKALPQLTVHQ